MFFHDNKDYKKNVNILSRRKNILFYLVYTLFIRYLFFQFFMGIKTGILFFLTFGYLKLSTWPTRVS